MFKRSISIFFAIFLVCLLNNYLWTQNVDNSKGQEATSDNLENQYPKPTNKEIKRGYIENKKALKEESSQLKEELKQLITEYRAIDREIQNLTNALILTNDKTEIEELLKERDEESLKAAMLKIEIVDKRNRIERLKAKIKIPFDGYSEVDGTYNWSKTYDISDIERTKAGTWSIHVKAKNNMEHWSQPTAINVKIDPRVDIPTINVINPRPNASIHGNLMIVGTAFDNNAVSKVVIFLNNEQEERECKGTDYWSYLLDTTEMTDGRHTLRVRVYDNNMTQGRDAIIPFYLDRHIPVITFNDVQSGDVLSDKMNVYGTVTNDNGIVEVSYSIDDKYSFKNASTKALTRNNTTVDFNFLLNRKDFSGGIQTIWVKAKNRRGSESYATLSIKIESSEMDETTPVKPEIHINSPSIDGERFSDDINITGIALGGENEISSVLYKIDQGRVYINENGDVVESKTPQEYSKWHEAALLENKRNWWIFAGKGKMAPGEHIIEIQAVNSSGIESEIKTAKFQLDYENPTIQLFSPPNGSYLKDEKIITGRATDPNGISEVEISTNSGWSFQIANGKENWNYYLNSKAFPDGQLKFLIKAKDNCDSESYSFALYNVDNTPPQVSIRLPKVGDSVSNIYRIEGRASDNVSLDKVLIKITDDSNASMLPKGTTDDDGYAETTGKEAWSYEIDTTKWANERYFISIKAVDLAGNVTEKTSFFSVDPMSDLPVVELDSPQSNQNITGEIVKFYGTASDRQGIDSVYIKIDNGEFVKANGTNIWEYSIPALNLTEGLHSVTVIAHKLQFNPNAEPKTSGPIFRTFYYKESGTVINIISHINGKPIEHRPWLRGTAEYYERNAELKAKKEIQTMKYYQLKKKFANNIESLPEIDQIPVSKSAVMGLVSKKRSQNRVKNISLTIDNGNTFEKAMSTGSKRFTVRLQSQYLLDGNHTLQLKAANRSNNTNMQYFKIALDRRLPQVRINTPLENGRFSGRLAIKGTADDENNEIEEVKLLFRRFDKNMEGIPKFIQGLYLWAQVYGGPLISTGIGLSFFDDIVRLEALFGWIPTRENMRDIGLENAYIFSSKYGWVYEKYAPRFSGFSTGGKILARVIDIPFEFLFGEDAKNFSWSIEIGAGFFWMSGYSGGTREEFNTWVDSFSNSDSDTNRRKDRVLAGFMFQWDFFKIERYRGFRKFALYLEASFYFIASEVKSELTPQIGFGVRNALF